MATIDDSQSTDDDAATAADTDRDDNTARDGDGPLVSPSDLSGLAVADDHEAAAIAAAIGAHLRDRQAAAAAAAAAAADGDEDESRRSWAFAGRLEAIGESANRPPNNTPQNGWSAAGRADRF